MSRAGDLGRQLRGYLRSSILVIDEVGYLPLNRHDANLVFQIIARRYEKGSVIITSNKAFSKAPGLHRRRPRHRHPRLLHHAHLVITKGDSHRLAEALAGKGVIPLAT